MVRGEPVFLSQVMDTIANLKESKGSPPDKILDHMAALHKAPIRNASLRVKKALRTGLRTGLLKESGGKFKLGLTTRDYAVLKKFGQLGKRSGGLSIPVIEHRRRRGRSRGRRRRGRRRRRSNVFKLGMGEDSADEDSFKDLRSSSKTGDLPVKELKRRRGRRGRSRRRRGRRRRRSDLYDDENLADSDENDGEPMDRSRRRRRGGRRRGKRRRGRRRGLGPEDDVDSLRSTESKDMSDKSSEEKPKTAKGRGRGEDGGKSEPEKRDIVTSDPPRSHIDHQENTRSSHCIHDHAYHHEGPPYSHHAALPPPHSHYGEHYYE